MKHYRACTHISGLGIVLLEDRFPDCLKLERNQLGALPPDFTLKQAFSLVLDNNLSNADKEKEFLRYGDAIGALRYTRQPDSTSLVNHFTELDRLRKMQQMSVS